MTGPDRDQTTLTFRPLQQWDLEAVQRIEDSVSPDPWSAALFADELAGDTSDRLWMVAVADGGEVVGFGGLLFIVDEAHIMNLAVAGDRQRQGIASALVSRLLTAAGDRGATGATLEVRASNRAALALYRRFRFEEAGRRPRYYPNGEDAVIMWVHRIYRPDYQRFLATAAGCEVTG
jgi:ribosomal-protein-alanine N-acetyltransferase